MRAFIIILIAFAVCLCWMFFAALQEDDILTQEELEELANALWESDDDES